MNCEAPAITSTLMPSDLRAASSPPRWRAPRRACRTARSRAGTAGCRGRPARRRGGVEAVGHRSLCSPAGSPPVYRGRAHRRFNRQDSRRRSSPAAAPRRMGGGDKGLLPLGGRPILAHVIERLAPQVERAGAQRQRRPGALRRLRPAGARRRRAGRRRTARRGARRPRLGGRARRRRAGDRRRRHAVPAARPRRPPRAPAPGRRGARGRRHAGPGRPSGTRPAGSGRWRCARRCAPRSPRGERRVGAWAEAQGCAWRAFADADAFFNVNTPADLARGRGDARSLKWTPQSVGSPHHAQNERGVPGDACGAGGTCGGCLGQGVIGSKVSWRVPALALTMG